MPLIYRTMGQGGIEEYELVTVQEAVETLPFCERQIRRRLDEGKLIGIKPGRDWLVQKHLSKTRPHTGRQDVS